MDEACEFVDEHIRPYAAGFDLEQGIPRTLIDLMANKGYLGACLPLEYGGLGLDAVNYGLLTEVFGKGCASVRSILTVHTSLVGETLMRWGTEEQKRKYLPVLACGEKLAAFALSEPEIGSDAAGIQTSYVERKDHYLLNGRKTWITMGGIADLFLVFASNEGRTTALLVEAASEGVSTALIKNMMAARASYIADVYFEDVVVPKENLVGREGTGFSYIVNTALDFGRYSIAWGGIAIAQEALEAMVAYARKRRQFGAGIHSFQLIQEMIGDAVAQIAAGRALCVNAGNMRTQQHSDAAIETTMAKYFTSRIANKIASDAVQIHGGNGFTPKYPVERLFREAKVLEIIEGTSQILQGVIAHHGLSRFKVQSRKLTVKS